MAPSRVGADALPLLLVVRGGVDFAFDCFDFDARAIINDPGP